MSVNDELYKALQEETRKRRLSSVQETARYILSEYSLARISSYKA